MWFSCDPLQLLICDLPFFLSSSYLLSRQPLSDATSWRAERQRSIQDRGYGEIRLEASLIETDQWTEEGEGENTWKKENENSWKTLQERKYLEKQNAKLKETKHYTGTEARKTQKIKKTTETHEKL